MAKGVGGMLVGSWEYFHRNLISAKLVKRNANSRRELAHLISPYCEI